MTLRTVVRQSNYELNHELAASSHNSTASSPVGVLPADAIILLVEADDVRVVFDLTIGLNQGAAEVLTRR